MLADGEGTPAKLRSLLTAKKTLRTELTHLITTYIYTKYLHTRVNSRKHLIFPEPQEE